jgi:hypothetical protein
MLSYGLSKAMGSGIDKVRNRILVMDFDILLCRRFIVSLWKTTFCFLRLVIRRFVCAPYVNHYGDSKYDLDSRNMAFWRLFSLSDLILSVEYIHRNQTI